MSFDSTSAAIEPPDVHYMRAFYSALEAIGITPAQRDAALRAADARRRSYWGQDLGMFAMQSFARALADEVGDPFVGIRLGAAMADGSNGVVEYIMLTAPTLRAIQQIYARFSPLLAEYLSYGLREYGGYTGIYFEAPPGVLLDRVVEDFRLVRVVAGIRRATQQRDFTPSAVHFTYARPSHLTPLEDFFGKSASLEFGCDLPAVLLPSGELDKPLPTAEPTLHRILVDYAQELLGRSEPPAKLATRVRQLLVTSLHEGRPSLGSVAKKLSMSERTLRRHLAEEGTSFGELLDQVRASLSQVLSKSSERSGKSIASKLGFESASAFRRAQKRWQEGSQSPV